MEKKKWLQIKILGIKVDFVGLKQAVEWVEERIKYNKKGQIVTPNPEQVVLAQKDKEFARVLNQADLAVCDGVGLSLAAKLKIKKLSGTDLMVALCQRAAKKGWRVMLMGGRSGVAEVAATKIKNSKLKIQNCNAKFKIMGINGALDIKNETEEEKKKVVRQINQFHPHLLFVAYGAPYQEKWIAKNLAELKVNVAMGVGGAFDYLTGRVSRAPKWIRDFGFEWLWRLIFQPWRIRRQLRLIEFVWLVVKNVCSHEKIEAGVF